MNKNLLHTIATSLLLCAGLASCEMKDELTGNMGNSSEVGYLDLGVAVNGTQNVITKADEVTDGGEQTDSSVSADDFPVLIKGVTDPTYEKSFAHFSEIKNPIELPVGSYTVTAHSNLDLKSQMPVPYYEGTTKNNLVITKDVESKADVICKMKNTRIQLNYTGVFTASFDEWTITFNDGKKNTLTFEGSTSNASNPAPVYWLISENVSEIQIHVRAKVKDSNDWVNETRTLTKPAGSDSDYWTGGDALNIEMNGIEPDPENPTGVTGIEIKVDVTFDEEEESVEVPVTPGTGGGDEPTPDPDPEPSAPEITLPQSTYTLPGDASANANVVISAPAGLKSVNVRIDPDTDLFEGALGAIASQANFLTGVEMVGNTAVSSIVGAIAPGVTAPSAGDTSYTFPVGSFFNIISDLGTTEGDGHAFIITVTDNNDESDSATLYVKNVTGGE